VDWEGGKVFSSPASWSEARLSEFAQAIRSANKRPGFVPYWPQAFDDAAITRSSQMAYELAQIQDHCVDSAASFARGAQTLLTNFRSRGLALRDVGFEISLNSIPSADNHVGVDRAAQCTRAAYGKGARAIYIYGNGKDQFEDYFKALERIGVRNRR
jgi:hypothetical protein